MSAFEDRLKHDTAVRGLFMTSGLVISAFFPFLALYLNDKGLSGSEIGVVIASMAVARILLNPIWGHMADTRARAPDLAADRAARRGRRSR